MARCDSEHSVARGAHRISYSFYAKMPCINFGEVLHNVSYLRYTSGIRIALEAMLLNLHAKLTPGWALIRVNFDPIQEAKSRKWTLFREWALFRETTVITSWTSGLGWWTDTNSH